MNSRAPFPAPFRLFAVLLAAWMPYGAVSEAADLVLSWSDNSDNEAGFKIERALGSGAFAQVATTAANAATYTDTGLEPATAYRYRVCAYNACGDSAWSNEASATTAGVLPSNTAPTIGAIADRAVVAGTGTGPIAVRIGDAETAASALVLAGRSSAPSLVADAAIVFGGAGADRTVTVTPTPGRVGTAAITITVSDGALETSRSFTVLVEAPTPPPTIVTAPSSQVATAGQSATLSVVAQGSGTLRYQWLRDGQPVAGATAAQYVIPCVQAWHAGNYSVVVTSGNASVTSEPVTLAAAAPTPSGARLLNLSTRAWCESGETAMMLGFVVAGGGAKRVMLRAVGPRLADFGVGGAMADPKLLLRRREAGGFVDVASNDDWGSVPGADAVAATAAQVGAFALAPGSADAVLLLDLAPGIYTAEANVAAGSPGVAMVEFYDADEGSAGARLVNLSNRGWVGTGENIMIPGFVVSDEGSKTVLIRAVGPRLADFGVGRTLADPRLTVYRRAPGSSTSEAILQADDWGENGDAVLVAAMAADVGAFVLTPGSRDAAIVATLPPGSYTVHASGADGGVGVGLVEVYDVD